MRCRNILSHFLSVLAAGFVFVAWMTKGRQLVKAPATGSSAKHPPRRPGKRKRDVSPPPEAICLPCDGWVPPFFADPCPRPAVVRAHHPTSPTFVVEFCFRCAVSVEVQQAYGHRPASIIAASERVVRRN